MWYFGILTTVLWAWIFWPVLIGIAGLALWLIGRSAVLFALDENERRYDDSNPFIGLVFGVSLVLLGVHFGGIFDVVSFIRDHYVLTLLSVAAYLTIGVFYMIAKGAKRLIRLRSSRVQQLLPLKAAFVLKRTAELGNAVDAEQVQEEARQFVADHPLSKPVRVADYKAKMTTWAVLWLPDLLYHTVFQFFDRLKDLWDLLWHFMKGFLQRAVNRYWGDLASRVSAAEKVGENAS